ncbi:hypothetical protein P8452_64298 [Trifolium repens]|nr:hypothetical protein P8452_64298 [Trifolium repens]
MSEALNREFSKCAINGDVMPEPPVICWKQTIKKNEVDGNSVIEIPDRVVAQCLKDPKKIILTDEQNEKSYDCDIETGAGEGEGSGKFIEKGWLKCMEEMGLKDGDEVVFTVENSSGVLYVYLLEWCD